jgi:protein-S-isoprenylcysteine O-methyltransferase Ste14
VAPDAPEAVTAASADGPSPWWYRWRFATIGSVYFCGFFFGNLVTGILGLPVVPAVLQWGAALGPNGPRILYGVAFLFALIAWALRAWGGAYLRPDVVWNADALGDRLLVDGPFRYVRNPLYLGNLFLALAAGLLAPPLGFAIVVVGNVFVALALAGVESRLLRARYGAAYDAYAAAVPALVPRLSPARVEGSVRGAPSLALGLRSEIFSAILMLSLLAVWLHALASP